MTFIKTAFRSLSLGSIKPQGWLKDQLQIQADGFTGHLDEHWPDVGPNSSWLGGTGESWERGPYYLDGLVPLAYLLEDERLIAKADKWIEWTLRSQRKNGDFGPAVIAGSDPDSKETRDWWPYMIMLKALTQHEEATGDLRVIPFISDFFKYVRSAIEEQPLKGWAEARGAEMTQSILWLHSRTSEQELLELARIVAGKTLDWSAVFHDFPFWRKVEEWDHRTHVVNVAMGLKAPGVRYQLSGDSYERAAVERGIRNLMTYHGQAHGMFSGDEWLSGTHPGQGVELCAVVEYMFTLENLVRIFGDGKFGDILEKVAFNALPAAVSADWTSHQYDQQVNQIMCNVAKRNWVNHEDANIFGLEPNFGCCTANMHQGWPKLTSHLWMAEGDGGLSAISYAPCEVNANVGTGAKARLEISGDYPFREEVKISLFLDQSEHFSISFRIPEWCDAPLLAVNGDYCILNIVQGFARVAREWRDRDEIRLSLPIQTRTSPRNYGAVSVERGPLVYVLPIGENWQPVVKREKFHDWEVYPSTPWKFGLLAGAQFETVVKPMPKQPFEAANAPLRLKTSGQLIRDWRMEGNNAAAPPIHPVVKGQPVQELELVPYGSARLRIGEFPLIGKPPALTRK